MADSSTVQRFNAAGVLVQSYDTGTVNEFFALNLAPDGTSFYTGSFSTSQIYRFDIATGALLQTINSGAGSGQLFGLSVFGEITVVNPNPVPEPMTLFLFGTGLAGLAAKIRKRRRAERNED